MDPAPAPPSPARPSRWQVPAWAPVAALALSLALAWLNFLFTAKWADVSGALHGWKRPWYAAALVAATVLAVRTRRRIGQPVRLGPALPAAWLVIGAAVIVLSLFTRLPLSTWTSIPFDDDWTPLYQAAMNGIHLMERGVVVGWNWWFLGGYPTSSDVSQSFAALAFVPVMIFGEPLGFHVVNAIWFLCVPVYVWWDLSREDREVGMVAAGFACLTAVGLQLTLGKSGDVNSLAGVFCAGLALVGSRAARLGQRWGGPAIVLGLTLALYSHIGFFGYAVLFLALESVYFRDRAAAIRLVAAAAVAGVAALPVHWETLRYPAYVSLNNVVFNPHGPIDWPSLARHVYYNVEMLAQPHRWFNDYRSLVNIWQPVVLVLAVLTPRSRVGFYAWAALLTQVALRFNAGEFGAGLDRIQHMLPMLAAPALAGFVLRYAGTRGMAVAIMAVVGLYVQVTFLEPVPHVTELRQFNPPLIDRLRTLDGNLILVETSPHRDTDSDPITRTARTPWGVHFEALLPGVAGQRFYSQMWDGFVWSSYRAQVVSGGAYAGYAIGKTEPSAFEAEMRRWGVKHLLVWTDATRAYLAASPSYVERWRDGLWADFELVAADVRSATTASGLGSARLTNLDFLGADVELQGVSTGDVVVLRGNYYPAWRARVGARAVALFAHGGQLAFRVPESGTYTVRLDYPTYRGLSLLALVSFLAGCWGLTRLVRPRGHDGQVDQPRGA